MLRAQNLIDTVIDRRYRLLRHLGDGSYGTVYEASQEAFGQHVARVAVKLVAPSSVEEREALLKETQALARLNHPNILRFLNVGEEPDGIMAGTVYVVTELAENCLGRMCEQSTRVPEAVVREVAISISSALEYIHAQGAVHRDVKPGNVLQVGGTWKLGDFGMVRAMSGSLVSTSGRKGTLGYVAPEQLDGHVGPASDVYSLGVTLLQCLTGRLAHEGSSEGEFMRNLMTQPAQIPDELPEPWRSAIARCLVREPRERCSPVELPALLSDTQPPPHERAAQTGTAQAADPPASPSRSARRAPAARRAAPRRWERAGATAGEEIEGPDGGVYLWVPPAEFNMGSLATDPQAWENEKPLHRVRITSGFWLAKHQVTNARHRQFCEATGRAFPARSNQGDDRPVVSVTWEDANEYCLHFGLSLPTEAEWEYSARGPRARVYPWGSKWDLGKCCNGRNRGPGGETMPVDSLPRGASWCGALHLAGNVWEWCADWWDSRYYRLSPIEDPPGPAAGSYRVVRGASWYGGPPKLFRGAKRGFESPDIRQSYIGFRCVIRVRR